MSDAGRHERRRGSINATTAKRGQRRSDGDHRPRTKRPFRLDPAWFAGVDLDVLAKVPSERTFYRLLGTGVLLLACASGVAFSFALGYVLHEPAGHLWWAGLGWTLFVACGIEPLILQVYPARHRWVLVFAIAWRVCFSALLALQLSEPLILRINEPEINKQLHIENAQARQQAVEETKASFDPRIAKDLDQLQEIEARETALQSKAEAFRFQSEQSAESECGPECRHLAEVASRYETKLAKAEAKNAQRTPALNNELDRLREERRGERREGQETIHKGDGLWARIGALQAVAKTNSEMNLEVWAIRLLCLLLDLLPLTIKLIRMFSLDSPYEDRMAAARGHDGLDAEAEEADTEVEKLRITEKARTDKEIVRAEAILDAERRLSNLGLADDPPKSGPFYPGAGAPPVAAPSLSEFVDEMTPHDTEPVTVHPDLRRSGLFGLASIGGLMVLVTLLAGLAHHAISGTWLIVLVFAAAAVLAVRTHGFRRAPAWALRAIFATFLIGLFLPFVIVVLNV